MRRLPVYFLIDVSESMVGEPINKVSEGIKLIIANLSKNPNALENAFISIIVFAGKPKTIIPLSEILQFETPSLFIGGGTALGKAMNFLMDELNQNVKRTTLEEKGDWKPIVFLMTDGIPTDDVYAAQQRWIKEFSKHATLIAFSFGNKADTSILNQFTDKVFIFDNTDPKSYSEFFQWISTSIESKSLNIAFSGDNDFELEEINENYLRKENSNEFSFKNYENQQVVLISKCQKTLHYYLINYLRDTSTKYSLENTYPISDEYFELSDELHSSINTQLFDKIPECPYCRNKILAHCDCGKLFCMANPGENICPWCNKSNIFEFNASIDISKTQG